MADQADASIAEADATKAAQELQTDDQGAAKPAVEPEAQVADPPVAAQPIAYAGEPSQPDRFFHLPAPERMKAAGIETSMLRLEGGGVFVEGEVNPFSGEGSMNLIERFRELLGKPPQDSPAAEAVSTEQPAATDVHDFPDEGPSAVCTKCGHRRWQLAPGQLCSRN